MSQIHRGHYLGYAIMGIGFASLHANVDGSTRSFTLLGVAMLLVFMVAFVQEYFIGDSDE